VLPCNLQPGFILPELFGAGLICVNMKTRGMRIIETMLGVIAAPASAVRHAGRRDEDAANMRSER